jgi:ribosomal protein L7Ae-like RNA K-turn-binding protein
LDFKQKALNLIGLATKAGKTKSGEFSTEQSVKKNRACLVVVSEEASNNTKKMFQDMCRYYHVECICLGSKAELGRACGKEMRASLAVEDVGFAEAIGKQMTMNGGSEV